jgi:hypothetical protein
MLRRLMSWCVPDTALRMQRPGATANPTIAEKPDMTSVESVLQPYKEELEVGGYQAASIYTVNP